jgi:hypothetical protein
MKELNSDQVSEIGLRIQTATLGLASNNHDLITAPEYFGGAPHPAMAAGQGWLIRSQEANCEVHRTDFRPPPEMDGYFTILDQPGVDPALQIEPHEVRAVGDWSALEASTLDRRYSLLGNQGVLFRFFLTLLEQKGVYSFHACGLRDRQSGVVYLVLGERGSGKSALLLSALNSDRYQSFGTEIVHAGFEGGELVFYRGCLRNNARVGHLIYDFPGLAEKIGVAFQELENPWGTKVQIDFGKYAVSEERIVDPELVLVIPRIEEKLGKAHIETLPPEQHEKVKRTLLENLSDKIVTLALIYETIPIGSLDRPELLAARKRFVDDMMERAEIARIVNLFASPHNCLEGLEA